MNKTPAFTLREINELQLEVITSATRAKRREPAARTAHRWTRLNRRASLMSPSDADVLVA